MNWDSLATMDPYEDTVDIMGFAALYPVSISSYYGYTYSVLGNQTGYDCCGSHSSDSLITKANHSQYGITWNVEESYFAGKYQAHYIKTSVYFTPADINNNNYQKLFMKYEHNYKSYSLQPTASISYSSIGPSASLNVSYVSSNLKWSRASNGVNLMAAQ